MRKRLTSHRKWRFPLIRWHRRIGLIISVMVLWLSVTGLLLNHSDNLQLDEKPVGQSLLYALYDIELPKLTSFKAADHWVSHLGANHTYLDGKEVAYCASPFNGAVWYDNQYIVSCGDGLLLLTQGGEVLERLGPVYGFPQPIIALATLGDQLLLNTSQGVVSVNLEQLEWQPYDGDDPIEWATAQQAPSSIVTMLTNQSNTGNLTWERVLIDLHNGRLAGRLGVWILDASAILLIVLAISGVWIWTAAPPR